MVHKGNNSRQILEHNICFLKRAVNMDKCWIVFYLSIYIFKTKTEKLSLKIYLWTHSLNMVNCFWEIHSWMFIQINVNCLQVTFREKYTRGATQRSFSLNVQTKVRFRNIYQYMSLSFASLHDAKLLFSWNYNVKIIPTDFLVGINKLQSLTERERESNTRDA